MRRKVRRKAASSQILYLVEKFGEPTAAIINLKDVSS